MSNRALPTGPLKALLTIATTVAILLAVAPNDAHAEPFRKGSIRLGGGLGYVQTVGGDGFVSIGLSGGYFLVDGLELGIDGSAWIGANPSVTILGTRLTYVVFQVPHLHPYAGPFYRHWFVGQQMPDIDTIGVRGGLIVPAGPRFYAFGGVGYERVVSACDRNCSNIFPEFGLSFVL